MPKTEADQAGSRGRQWGANQIGEHAKPEEADQADAEPDRQDASHPPMRILSARIHFHFAAHLVARDIGQRTRRKTMAEEALKTLPFAQPTQCRRDEGRVAIVTGAEQG